MAYRRPTRPKLNEPKVGPITQFMQAKEYLDKHRVPVMFESLIASLMLEKPDNLFQFLDAKLEVIQEIGIENLDWDNFISHLHPSRNAIRNEYVHENPEQPKEDQAPFADFNEVRPDVAGPLEDVDPNYKPELFITEPDDDDDDNNDVPLTL